MMSYALTRYIKGAFKMNYCSYNWTRGCFCLCINSCIISSHYFPQNSFLIIMLKC